MTDADLVGAVVGGKYQVRSKIGTGSMGDVYEAENAATQQVVALKVLRVDDATLAARFLREAKTMSLFQHPNIVELLEVGTHDDGRLFFAAELVRGSTLRVLLEDGPVEPRRALAIVRQVVDALGHAHAMGVVHRDIKPENVMIGAGTEDHVKILDFGVAKLIGDTPAVLGEGTLTITGYGALGTPYYISPEAVLGRALDARADLYSVGVMLFEMLTGKPPYMHDDVAVLMRMHAAAPIPKLGERNSVLAVTPELELVVSEALAKKPELRFKSAAEMIVAIDAAARSLEPLPADGAPKSNKSTDLFGALPMKAPAPPPEPSASAPAAFSPTSIPSASQPVQPEPGPPVRKSERRPLPGVTPYTTPVAGSSTVPPPPSPLPPNTPNPGPPVIGVVVPARGAPHDAPLFSPPMPQHPPQLKQPSKLFALAHQHRKYVIAGIGVFALVIIVVIAITAGGGGQTSEASGRGEGASTKSKRSEIVKAAQERMAAGLPAKALELLEAEPLGEDAEAYLVLGHAQISSGRRLDGVGSYERALAIESKHRADPLMRAHVERVLDTRDVPAVFVALELAARLEPPLHDAIVKLASSSKQADIRQRAFAIAEREKLAGGVDAVASWSLDLAQASSCEERLAAVRKLKRAADPKALPALKRARSHKCVEREVAEAMAAIEQQQPAKP